MAQKVEARGGKSGNPWDNQSDCKDNKITGFHGFSRDYVHSLGTYFAPLTNSTTLIPAKKLEAKGGDAGAVWNDGVHDGVKKVYVGQGQNGIAFVKFKYHKGSQEVVGDEHGKRTVLGVDEFEIDADDYIVYVEGHHEQVITSLRFKTYKGKTSQLFGVNSGTKFVLQGGKIVGFHGHVTDVLHSLGAYVVFSATSTLDGKWMKMEQNGDGPGPRCSHGIAMVGNKIYTFGGELIPNQPIDKHLYVFDIENRTWSIAPATGYIPELACIGVKMVSIGSTLYTFGGGIVTGEHNGFYSFDTVKNEWKLLTHVDEGPDARCFHSMAADDKNVYVFGGVSNAGRVKTVDAYNIFDKKWVQCAIPGESLCARGGSGLEVVNGKVWVVYGFNGCDEMDDVYYLDLAQNKWTQVETTGEKPSPRSVFASATVGKYIIMFGGEIAVNSRAHAGPGLLIDGTFALDTETLKWERLDKFETEEEESPSARGWSASMTATINGKKGLLMLGGKAPSNDRFDDLFFYALNSA